VFTGLCAFAQGYWDLVTIAGLGLGGEFGIGMVLVAEAWPAAKRARAFSYVALGWQAGVLAAALITPALLPSIGWRGMFIVGLIPGVIAFAVRWYVGEPRIFLEKASKPKVAAPLRLLVKDGAARSWGCSSNGMLGGYGALLLELYPTEARATAENVLFNLGRGVGGFGPFVVGALAVSYSFAVAIGLLAVIYLIDIVATLFLIPEKRGEPLV
jgi:MFS family permease